MHAPETHPDSPRSLRRTRQASLGEIVQRLREIHVKLSAQYGHMALNAPNDRLRLILTFLTGNEMALAAYLQQFLADAHENVLQRRFKYVPDLIGDDLLDTFVAHPGNTPDELATLLLEIHHAIDAVYEPLGGNLLPEELGDVLEKLRLQEKEHLIAQLRAVNDE